MTSLELRIRALEDVQAISNLKSRYLDAVNGGWDRPSHNGDQVSEFFTEDGEWELMGVARAQGRQAIRDTLNGFRPYAPFALHVAFNPLIEVAGDAAIGAWHLLCPSNTAEGKDYLSAVVYRDQFVRVGDRWLFKSLHARFIFAGLIREASWSSLLGRAPTAGDTRLPIA